MTQQLTAPRPDVATRLTPRRPGLTDYVWLVWRQHGGLIVTLGVLTLVLCTALVIDGLALASTHCVPVPRVMHGPLPAGSCGSDSLANGHLYPVSTWLLRATMFAPVVFGVLWGAPLVAPEHEAGTTSLSWGQGISARRWLVGKVCVLAVLAVLMSLALWACARPVAAGMGRVAGFELGGRFGPVLFATSAPLIVPYALAALAVGVLASVLLKQTLPGLALAAAVCLGLGVGNTHLLRPHYLQPRVVHGAIGDDAFPVLADPLVVSAGWADARGHLVKGYPVVCRPEDRACLNAHGIYSQYVAYQPASREAGFQWIEAGLAMLTAGLAGALALWQVGQRKQRRDFRSLSRPTVSTSASASTSTAPARAVRTAMPKPRLRSYVWLIWRQHGGMVVWSAVATAVLCTALLLAGHDLATTRCTGRWVPWRAAGNCQAVAQNHLTLYTWSTRLLMGVVFAPVLLGALWGAPLVAREHQRGTQALAWGQGVSARRWLAGKLTALALLSVVLALPLWLCARPVAASMLRLAPLQVGQAFGWVPFATLSPLVVAYSLASLAVGVLASVLLRRTIAAVVVTLIVCVGLGVGTADLVRPHYLTPAVEHAGFYGPPEVHNALSVVEFAFTDADGHQVQPHFTVACGSSQPECFHAAGVLGTISAYQPGSREAEFQWIEGSLALVLAGAFGALALWRLRRR